jgi:hypothetical protein
VRSYVIPLVPTVRRAPPDGGVSLCNSRMASIFHGRLSSALKARLRRSKYHSLFVRKFRPMCIQLRARLHRQMRRQLNPALNLNLNLNLCLSLYHALHAKLIETLFEKKSASLFGSKFDSKFRSL